MPESPQRKKSDAIREFYYNPVDKILTVEFRNGMRYAYHDVPAEVADDMARAESWGKFYLKEVKGHYRYVLMSRAGVSRG